MATDPDLFHADRWHQPGHGPRYQQLARHISAAIAAGDLGEGQQLPPERDLAELADVSRVTIRKAVAELVADGLIEQRRGAGSFVRPPPPKLKQNLSSLVSFTENMRARGYESTSRILSRGLFAPTPDEMLALGLAPGDQVARVERLRYAGDIPMALEKSSLPVDILPDPELVDTSLYAVLRASDSAPTRAIQRVTAQNISTDQAAHLNLPDGSAVLKIARTAYLDSGRPIEFTCGFYRSDIYDFVVELRHDTMAQG